MQKWSDGLKIAIIGASGKTGQHLVRTALDRQHRVSAVCRTASSSKLDEHANNDAFEHHTHDVISHEPTLARALEGCDACVAIPITVRALKTTTLVRSLQHAMEANGVRRASFTAGEVTTPRAPGERYTPRQALLRVLAPPIVVLTPYSIYDMLEAGRMIQSHDWDWTIVRAPTLIEGDLAGYRFCEIDEVTGRHKLTRADYAATLLDVLDDPSMVRRSVTVVPEN